MCFLYNELDLCMLCSEKFHRGQKALHKQMTVHMHCISFTLYVLRHTVALIKIRLELNFIVLF